MQTIKKKLHNNSKGFTLAEVLIAVALIVILLGLSVPGIVKQQKSLKKMELDRTAEEIFLSMQDSFSNVRLNGRLKEAMKLAGGDYYGAYPGDYLGKAESSDKKFHSMSSGTDNMYKKYVETFSLKSLGMPFAAEYTEDGDVYSVFYAEDQDVKSALFAAASSGDVDTLNSYREDEKVGYYTTKSLENTFFIDEEELNVYVPMIKDGDSLYADIHIKNGLNYAGISSNITYMVSYTSGGKKIEKTYNGSAARLNGEGDLVLSIKLDSLEDNIHFYNDVAPELPVGQQVKMTVENVVLKAADGKTTINMATGASHEVTFNPLFTITNTSAASIEISCARHLNNLRSDYFSLDAKTASNISQTEDIDVSAVSKYGPIRNDNLFSDGTVYNGNGHKITGLNISEDDGGCAGLFAKFACTVKDVSIYNPHVSVSADCVGALCGEIAGGKILNCRVLCDKEQADGCYVNGYGEFTGGLIGLASNTEIKDSFAAVDVTGCGGFAGKLAGCDVEHCYSSGKVTAVGYPAGGFAAYAIDGNVRNCYTTSDVISSANCGGFAYEVSGVSSCNAYGRTWDGGNIYIDVDNGFGPFAVSGSAADCYFLVMPGYNDVIGDHTDIGEKYEKDYRTSPGDRKAWNYTESLDKHANVFPFESLGITNDHYGNWPHGYITFLKDKVDDETHSYQCIAEGCGLIDKQPHNYSDNLCLTCDHQKTDTENGGGGSEETP